MSSSDGAAHRAKEGVGGEDPASLYAEWVREEAQRMNSDGCTAVSEWNQWCCFEHDLGCEYLKDPKDAFRLWQSGEQLYWTMAKSISRREVDQRYALCNFRNSQGLVDWSRTGVRYLGVRIKGIWNVVRGK